MNYNTSTDAPLLTERESAALLSISTRTLQAWRGRSVGPAFVRVGRAIRYQRSELIRWIKENTATNRASDLP